MAGSLHALRVLRFVNKYTISPDLDDFSVARSLVERLRLAHDAMLVCQPQSKALFHLDVTRQARSNPQEDSERQRRGDKRRHIKV